MFSKMYHLNSNAPWGLHNMRLGPRALSHCSDPETGDLQSITLF